MHVDDDIHDNNLLGLSHMVARWHLLGAQPKTRFLDMPVADRRPAGTHAEATRSSSGHQHQACHIQYTSGPSNSNTTCICCLILFCRLEVEGSVDGARRHGRHLVFARVSGFSQQIVFDSKSFHTSCNATEQHSCPETHPAGDLASKESAPNAPNEDPFGAEAWEPFPASKSSLKAGDRVWISARDIDGRITVWRWRRLSSCTPASNPSAAARVLELPAQQASEALPPAYDGSSKGRRAGLAVARGWVGCPLCPSTSLKRFNRGAGLESHLTAVHADALQR